jgi:hypothetical protein
LPTLMHLHRPPPWRYPNRNSRGSFCCMVQFSTLPALKKVSFGTSIIQRSRRVALDPNLLETLKLKEGDKVRVELDVDSETILIRRAIAVPQKRSRDGEQSRA